MKQLIGDVLDYLKTLGASYGDVRVVRQRKDRASPVAPGALHVTERPA